jgi:hypothetical protein
MKARNAKSQRTNSNRLHIPVIFLSQFHLYSFVQMRTTFPFIVSSSTLISSVMHYNTLILILFSCILSSCIFLHLNIMLRERTVIVDTGFNDRDSSPCIIIFVTSLVQTGCSPHSHSNSVGNWSSFHTGKATVTCGN